MNSSTRPNLGELRYFASLLKPVHNTPTTDLQYSDVELAAKLDYHGITALALQAGSLSLSVTKILGARKALMVAADVLKQNALIELFEAFEAAGLSRHILFKGSALAYSIYPQPWLRPRSDSDCLIDFAQRGEFAEVFERLGYVKLFAIEGKHISYQQTYSKPLAGQSAMDIDLHWRINNRQILARSYGVDELLTRSDTLTNLSSSINIPSIQDSLIIASLHRLGHHHGEERLAWLYDIDLLANALDQQGWEQLCASVKNKRLAAITLDALALCHELFETPIPSQTLAALEDAAQLAEPSQLFLNRELSDWQYFMYDLKAIDGLGKKIHLIFENFFPSPAYVRKQMNTRYASLGYVKRIWRGLKRITS